MIEKNQKSMITLSWMSYSADLNFFSSKKLQATGLPENSFDTKLVLALFASDTVLY